MKGSNPYAVVGRTVSVVKLTSQDLAVEGHLLDRLRGGSVELATDVEPLGVGVDAELDCGVEFCRIDLCRGIHRCQVGANAG